MTSIDDLIAMGVDKGFLHLCKTYRLNKGEALQLVREWQEAGRGYRRIYPACQSDFARHHYQFSAVLDYLQKREDQNGEQDL